MHDVFRLAKAMNIPNTALTIWLQCSKDSLHNWQTDRVPKARVVARMDTVADDLIAIYPYLDACSNLHDDYDQLAVIANAVRAGHYRQSIFTQDDGVLRSGTNAHRYEPLENSA